MKKPDTLLLFTGLLFCTGLVNAEMAIERSVSLVINVLNKDKSANALIEYAENRGGYYKSRSENAVLLKVPVGGLDSLLLFAENLGWVLKRDITTTDRQSELRNIKSKLKSKKILMDHYIDLLNSSELEEVLSLEKKIIGLTGEIESLMGDLKLHEHRLSLATVEIAFRFKVRKLPPRRPDSNFGWINRLDVTSLIQEFKE